MVTLTRTIPANFMAIAMWANNRMPENFRRNAGKEFLDEKRFELEQKKYEESGW